MEEERLNQTISGGEYSEKQDKIYIKPTTGLTDGQISKNVSLEENKGIVAKLRHVLFSITKK